MTKTELANAVHTATGDKSISKTTIGEVLDSLMRVISEELTKGGEISFVGIGKLSLSVRKEREGRNPRTGAVIQIPEKKAVRFKTAKGLDDLLNKEKK